MALNNTDLLRRLDFDAARRGELVCEISDPTECEPVLSINRLHEVVVDWPSTGFVLYSSVSANDLLRMAPLCWHEGRPVYKGDVLYWRPENRRMVVKEIKTDGPDGIWVIGEDRCCYMIGNLAWSPSVKREGWVNIYPGIETMAIVSDVWPTQEMCDMLRRPGRVACVRIEWEEPDEGGS